MRNRFPIIQAIAIGMCLFIAPFAVRAGDAEAGNRDTPGGPLRILSGPEGGQWHALGEEIAFILGEAGIPARNEAGGGVENLRLVGEGGADVGFTLYSFLGAAGAGEKELPAINLDNAVLMACLYPQVFYLVVRGEIASKRNLKSLGDLLEMEEPLRFATLPAGTGSEFIFRMLLKNGYGVDYRRLESQGWNLAFQSYADIADGFRDGVLDACAYTAGPGLELIPDLQRRNRAVRILPVEEETLGLMTRRFMTFTSFIEPRDHRCVEESTATIGDYTCLVIRNDLPGDLVHGINKALWERKHRLARISSDMRRFSPRTAIVGQSKVHPGSLRFWNTPEMEALKKQRRRR